MYTKNVYMIFVYKKNVLQLLQNVVFPTKNVEVCYKKNVGPKNLKKL